MDLTVRRAIPAITAAILFSLIVPLILSAQERPVPEPRWFKGNTHTHTLNSDGDSTPDEVVRWYREHGYQFLVLSDHNFLTSVDALNALHGADQQFLVIPGEEVTDRFGDKPIHVNGLDLHRLVEPQGGDSVVDTIQRNVDAIRDGKAIPHINHPNYGWAITVEDLADVHDYKLFEIFNGHPAVNNLGNVDSPGLEEVWDILLSRGHVVYGIAVDDAHVFKHPWNRSAARPGQGWVVVRATELSAAAIMAAMEQGEFYASTGVSIADYEAGGATMTITIDAQGATRYTTRFIGRNGRVLSEVGTNPAVYRFRGDEGYVRAKVIDSNANVAWTQPYFLDQR